MSLHDDLRKQARQLATREPMRPRQASLRRGVSAAYYAVFHLFVAESSRLLISGQNRQHLRDALARAFAHADMKKMAQQFATGNPQGRILSTLAGNPVPVQLQDVAQAFVDLQQARHEADYDLSRRFTRSETLDLIDQVDQAFIDWSQIRRDPASEAFMLSLLVFSRLRA